MSVRSKRFMNAGKRRLTLRKRKTLEKEDRAFKQAQVCTNWLRLSSGLSSEHASRDYDPLFLIECRLIE